MAAAPSGMLDHLIDVPNLITLGNVLLGVGAVMLLISGRPHLAAIVLVWCVYLDFLDGHLARGRFRGADHRRAFGQQLDTLADLVAFSVVPGLFLFTLGNATLWSGLVSLLFPLCGSIRQAYYNLYGLASGRFVGLPTTYGAALFSVLVTIAHFALGSPWWLLACVASCIALIQVTPMSVPKLRVPLTILFACAAGLSVAILTSSGA